MRVSSVAEERAREVETLYARACAPLIGLLTVVGGSRSEAEEVAQDAFVRLLENWPKIRHYEDPEGWVRGVAVRLLISRHRRTTVWRRTVPRIAPATTVSAEPAGLVGVSWALANLSEAHRAVVVLHYVYDLPVGEVAAQLGIPVGTVKSRLSRARTALEPLLMEDLRSK